MTRADERVLWLLKRMINRVFCAHEFLVAWDLELVNAFFEAFPEALRGSRFYTLGPASCPMLNRAAKRAEALGYLEAGVVGNQDARQYNQRTWCRTWSLTDAGRAAAKK